MTDKLSNSLLNKLRPPNIRNADEFANQRVFLPEGDSHEGRWHSRPYQSELLKVMSLGSRMRASGAPVREVVLLKSAQIGFTMCLLNSITYHIVHRPTNMGLYFPNRDSAVAFAKDSMTKYIAAQPSLEGLVSSEVSSDGKSSAVKKLFPGGSFRMLAANKGADVATISLRLVYADEIDLMGTVRNEGDPFTLISKRSQEFSDALLIWGGTPRGTYHDSRIWKLFDESDKRRYFIPCPKCDKRQYLHWTNFEIGKSDYNQSGFRCINDCCKHLIREQDKFEAVKRGFWRATNLWAKEGKVIVPGRAGYQVTCFYADSPTVAWPVLARKRVECGYDEEKLKSYYNTTLGLPTHAGGHFITKAQDILNQTSLATYDTAMDGQAIPNEISLITVGVDVQGHGSTKDARIEASVFGWARDRCWFLNHVNIPGNPLEAEVWNTLWEVCTGIRYVSEDGKKAMLPQIVFVDSGNGHSTMKVYSVCNGIKSYFACKGNSTEGKALAQRAYVGRNQLLVHVQTILAKDRITDMLKQYVSGDPDPEFHAPRDLDALIAAGWCSEYKQIMPGGKPRYVHNGCDRNESLDCWVYALAAMQWYTEGYEPERVWASLEKRALITSGQSGGKQQRIGSNQVDFGGNF